jgi:hypothetical protein
LADKPLAKRQLAEREGNGRTVSRLIYGRCDYIVAYRPLLGNDCEISDYTTAATR